MKQPHRVLRIGALHGRRLGFEFLERRDLLAVMRLVDWNTLNGPNDAMGEADFHTIFNAIGNETVQGNTKRLDILALEETDPDGPGGNSISRIESVLDALYPSTNYASVVSTVDGGGDATGFVYDTSTVTLLNSTEILPGTLTHKILRAKFQPVGTSGESDFYVYSVHLKSGDTGPDEDARSDEAALLRANADALGEGIPVLFVGDFNMKTSAEVAYTNLVAAGAGQLQDVADAPGDWYNNPSFKSLHSQDPRSTMDDRFDIQFASGEFFDDVGLEYVANSFHVFGNNGTHTFDMPITTGTGADPAVLTALVNASDHLPVVGDYELIVSTPNVRITETGGGTKVIEGGLYDTYNVVLDTVPSANVTVTVMPNAQVDVGNGAGVSLPLVFTPANALTPQIVIVHAADDLVGEGNHTGLITHTSASADAAYNALPIANVNVKIVDNDAPTIVINELDADQTGTDAAEFIELYDGGVGNVSLNGKVVVLYNGATDQSYLAFDLDGKSTDANGFFMLGNTGVNGIGVSFPSANYQSFAGNSLQNGQDAVALYTGNGSDFPLNTPVTTGSGLIVLLDAIVYDTNDPDDPGLLVLLEAGQPQVNEHEHGTTAGEAESLSRVPDDGNPRQTVTYVAKAPTPKALNQTPAAGVLITQSGSRVDVAEGGATDSYQLALQSIPTVDVMISVDPDGQTDLGAGAGVAIVLTFTPANALVPQTVMVTAVDDLAVEGTHTSVITHTATSADSAYNGIAIGNVVANIVDNDAAAPTSIVISEIMYNPASDESSPGVAEWIEIVNTGTTTVDLGDWLIDDEDGTNWGAIPAATLLSPNQAAVLFDTAFTSAATFRSEWSVPASALVVGVSWGQLSNSPNANPLMPPLNEIVQLLDNHGTQRDVVNFDDTNPWPTAADGPSIYLKNLSSDNASGANWARSVVNVNGSVSPSGPTFSTSDVGSPGRVFLPGDYNLNGVVDTADYALWRFTVGSAVDFRADGSGPSTGVPDGVVDQLDYAFWMANFGRVGVLSGGSGAGASGAGGGGVAAESSRALEGVAVESESSQPVTNASSAAVKVLAFDVALTDLAPMATLLKLALAAKPGPRLSTASSAATSNDLLLLGRPSLTIVNAADSGDAMPGSSDQDLDKTDQFFASLDDRELAAGARQL